MNTWFELKWQNAGVEFTTHYWLPAGAESNDKARGAYIGSCIAVGRSNGFTFLGIVN